jgi:hypothetical protein
VTSSLYYLHNLFYTNNGGRGLHCSTGNKLKLELHLSSYNCAKQKASTHFVCHGSRMTKASVGQ